MLFKICVGHDKENKIEGGLMFKIVVTILKQIIYFFIFTSLYINVQLVLFRFGILPNNLSTTRGNVRFVKKPQQFLFRP